MRVELGQRNYDKIRDNLDEMNFYNKTKNTNILESLKILVI